MNKKTINYVIYIIIGLIIIFASLLLFSIIKEKKVEELILNTPIVNIETQESKKIDAYVKNNEEAILDYKTNARDVISVDKDGNVLGLKEGNAIVRISYTTKDNKELFKECNVVVKDKIPLQSISLTKGDLLISKGSVYQLEPIIEPPEFNKRLTYESLNEDIVSVSDKGIVTANNVGNTSVNISYNDKSTSIKVYVIDESINPHITIMPTSIKVSNKMSLIVDEEKKINYTLEPADADRENIIMSIKDNDIIKIENDIVKALSVGQTTINLKTYNDINTNIDVTVNPKVNDLRITSKEELKLNVGSTSIITYELDPKDVVGAKVSFESSNPNVASINDDGTITGLSIGEATITIKCSSITKTVKVNVGNNYYQKIHFIKQTISNKSQDSEAGDAILLESNGHFAMIDTGYKEKVDNEFVYNYLQKKNVKKLDFILITHAHNDHYGGASYLMSRIKTDRLYIKSDNELAWVLDMAISKKVPVTYIEKSFKDGQGFTFDDMNIKLYNTQENGRNKNLTSVLELIEVNGYKVFLTGDLPRDGIDYMNKVSKIIGKVNVLKMPHHGYFECAMSITSAKTLNPDYVIVTNKFTKGRTGCYANFSSKIPIYYNKDSTKNAIVVDLSSDKIRISK